MVDDNNVKFIEQSNGSLTAKIASLNILQDIIKRMSESSFKIKKLYLSFLGFVIAIKSFSHVFQHEDFLRIPVMLLILLVMSVVCCLIDVFYLNQERIFRDIYNHNSKLSLSIDTNYFDFTMLIQKFRVNHSVCRTIKSFSISLFYGPIIFILVCCLLYFICKI